MQVVEPFAPTTAAAMAGRQQGIWQQWGLSYWNRLAVGNLAGNLWLPVHSDPPSSFLVSCSMSVYCVTF